MGDRRPIGIFDSGIGGLTVLSEIHKLLPNESLIYLGDTARVPYGTKSKETVIKYALNNLSALLKKDVKTVVIACNTASAYALDEVVDHADIPVIGVIEGGVKAAVSGSRNGKVGVIGTEATINSGAYENGIGATDSQISVVSKACPLFVALAEEGWTHDEVTIGAANRYLSEMKSEIDTLVLGCTHYPLLKETIGEVMGPDVKLIDSAYETAKLLEEALIDNNLLSNSKEKGSVEFLVTDSPERSLALAKKLLGEQLDITSTSVIDLIEK